jgi:hypothetical protein
MNQSNPAPVGVEGRVRPGVYWYSVLEHGGDSRYDTKFRRAPDFSDELDLEQMARLAADDYHSEHDGWESSWPLTFALYESEDGPEMARFEVDREAVPHFTAHRA